MSYNLVQLVRRPSRWKQLNGHGEALNAMQSALTHLPLDDEIPSFCWDRKWTVSEIRRRLQKSQGRERDRLLAWILREASYDEVWQYVTPREIDEALPRIESQLGRWSGMWRHLIKAWHELGKL